MDNSEGDAPGALADGDEFEEREGSSPTDVGAVHHVEIAVAFNGDAGCAPEIQWKIRFHFPALFVVHTAVRKSTYKRRAIRFVVVLPREGRYYRC